MSKLPYVERPAGYTIGLTGECAYLWALFLANEADMSDDVVAYDKWKALAEQLTPAPGKPVPSIVHCSDLETELETYGVC
jgi:hypothetical protein